MDAVATRLAEALLKQTEDPEHRMIQLELYIDVMRFFFSYCKCFDSNCQELDPDNYYMEREWRLNGFAYFNIADIKRVYLRRKGHFKERLLEEFPTISVHLLPQVS